MNSQINQYLLYAFSCFIFASCTKTTNDLGNYSNLGTNSGTNIYVAGNNGTNPVIWKNNTPEVLSSSIGYASQIILSGNNVYVAGISGQNNNSSPGGPGGEYVYWKNGIQQNIIAGGPEEISPSIAVSGTNVFYSYFDCFRNGVVEPLQGKGSGFIESVFASGTDFYAIGNDSVGHAAYWKNGVVNEVPFASCMYVSGNDVYLGGDNAYWKNGVITSLAVTSDSSTITNINSIFVAGNDVYVSGDLLVQTMGGINAPAYWKNGVEYDLPLNGAITGITTSIFVFGSDVYISGWTSSAGAVYWKNGVETILSLKGIANSIYVQ